MSQIIKVLNTAVVDDKDWVETYRKITEMKSLAVKIKGEEYSEMVNEYIAQLTRTAMKALQTNNHVLLSEVEDKTDSIVLIELDYVYTGGDLKAKSLLKENDELFIICE